MFETALQILGARAVFGAGRIAGLGEDVIALAGPAARVLLVSDPGVAAAWLAAPLQAALAGRSLAFTSFSEIRSDPLAAQIDGAAQAARDFGATIVVGLGGGSALDVAKLAAGVATAVRPAADYALECDPFDDTVLPVIAVPTTAGTGAEMTQSMVYSLADGAKVWCDAGNLRPRLALLDPQLTTGLPVGLTAATGADALVHAIESITSRRTKPETHAPALEAIRLIRAWLPVAVREPDDLEARGAMQLAAGLAGLAIDSGGTAVAHAMGHALGVLGHLHHGRAVAVSLRAALEGNAAAWPKEHAAVALAFALVGADDRALAAALPAAFDGFLREIGLEIGLGDRGLGPADAERLAAETRKPENQPMLKANSRELAEADVLELARTVLAAA